MEGNTDISLSRRPLVKTTPAIGAEFGIILCEDTASPD